MITSATPTSSTSTCVTCGRSWGMTSARSFAASAGLAIRWSPAMTAPEAPVPPAESRPRSAGGPLRRALWQIPLGGQLSLLYTVLLAVTLTLVGVLVYTQQEAFLAEDAATRLTQAATRI